MSPGVKWFVLIQSSQLFKPGAITVSVSQMKKIETHTGSNLLGIIQLISGSAGIWTQVVNSSTLSTGGQKPTINGL